ncbi:TetR/AcrR family transcriptional regulator [Streptomyces sp. NPDC058372]|uniref:TetR/AcrR family transcriptional regulator n=1 Tax=Streptomyces sp. NPDC058372 TaxID=3346464 RepID=UPI00364BCB01
MAAPPPEGRDGVGETGLPASVEAAWGLRGRPTKGPRPGLGVDRIVDAAVRLAASEGIPAVSMGRVAKELGASTMSLYRYVAAKDELFILMQEAATGLPPEDCPPPSAGWRARLTWFAEAYRDVLEANLWLLHIPISSPPATPNSVAWMEAGLDTLDGTGLDEATKLGVMMLIDGYVRSQAGLAADLAEAMRRSGRTAEESHRQYLHTLTRLADQRGPDSFPAVRRLLAAQVLGEGDDPEADFDWGLQRVLDGVGVLVGGGAR